MPKKPYLPRTELGRQQFLANFADKLTVYADKYMVTADVAPIQNFRLWFDWCVSAQSHIRERSRSYTQFRDALAFGDGASGELIPPQPFLLPDVPVATPLADGFGLLRSVVTRIKGHPAYAAADGEDLAIEGPEETLDPTQVKPVLTIVMQAGHPLIKWTKQGLAAIEIWVDRGNGVFAFLAVDSEPDYLDTAPLPAPGQSALWKYKAIYRLHDEPVGQWSDPVSVPVAG